MREQEFYPLSKTDILHKIEVLSKAYTSEWHFNRENPDIGSVIALLYADLLKQDVDVLNRAKFKHRIALLNCLETNLKVAVPAQGYITFEHIPGINEGIFIPKNTKVAARDSEGEDIIFSTLHGIYATDYKPTELIFSTASSDRIVDVYEDKGALEKLEVELFDTQAKNLQYHALYIAHPYILKDTQMGDLRLNCNMEDANELDILADSDKVEWQLLNEEGFESIGVKKDENGLIFTLKNIPQDSCLCKGIKSYWLRAVIKPNMPVPHCVTNNLRLNISKDDLKPNIVYSQDIECDKERFEPFGNALQIYSESYIRCDEAFSKIGASIRISFNLSYHIKRNEVPLPKMEVNYRYIMRKPKEPQRIDPPHIKADEVIWEYWNGRGWEKLFKNHTYDALFDGQQEGEKTLSFICPDIKEMTVNAFEAKWIRMRLVRADNIYTMPSIEHIPRIENLRISYGYPEGGLLPQKVICENNLSEVDATQDINNNKFVRLFQEPLFKNPSFLIGFDELPEKSPTSMFFNIENTNKLESPSFSFSYSTLQDEKLIFKKMKVLDGTKGLTQSGNMMFIFPKEMKKVKLYSKEKYWIMLENYTREYVQLKHSKPIIKGIFMNTARIINKAEEETYHYIVNKTGTVRFKLGKKNVIDVQVYINEKPTTESERERLLNNNSYQVQEKRDFKGETIEFWVKWKRCETETELCQGGRRFYVDYLENEIIFPDNIFTQISVNEEFQSVKIRYALCNGTKANRQPETINMLEKPISYISKVYNPVASFGGGDFETVIDATKRTSQFLANRARAVTVSDYESLIKTYSPTIQKVKCIPHINKMGKNENMSMTIVILEQDYREGNSILNTYKDALKQELIEKSELSLLAREIYIRPPEYIELSACIWIRSDNIERAYDYQNDIIEMVKKFIDPITGNFDGTGWDIGQLPEKGQLEAYLKSIQLDCNWQKIVLTGHIANSNEIIEKDIEDIKERYFVLPMNGSHKVIIENDF